MPMYSALRPSESDSSEKAARKKRIAARLLDLRTALRSHLGEVSQDARLTSKNQRIATWNLREIDSAS